MKLRTILMLMLAVLFFTACGDDDNDSTTTAQDVAATYTGTMDVSVMGAKVMSAKAQTVTIETETGAQTVKVTMNSFSYGANETLPNIVASGIVLTSNGSGKYTLAEKSFSTTDSNNKTMSGKVSGTIENGKATLTFTEVKYGAMPVSLTIDFTGTATK